jgi:hypothetical protein
MVRHREAMNMAARVLARIRWKGQDYFLDDRLGELRRVAKPWVSIPLSHYRAMRIIGEGHCIEKAHYLDDVRTSPGASPLNP